MVVKSERINLSERPTRKKDEREGGLITLLILSVTAILPFWTVRYPVMADYPNHLARWFVLFHLRDAAYHFQNLYAPAWGPLPYITPDLLAMALQHFLPIDVVGRCVLSLGIVSIGVSTLFLLRHACPENSRLAAFGLLVALNPMFLMGSISYEYSIALCLFVVALWVSYCKCSTPLRAIGITFGLVAVYLSHLIGFFVAGLAMGLYAIFQEGRWRKLVILAALSAPALLILISHPIRAGGGASFVYEGLTPWSKVKETLFPIRLYTSKVLDFTFLLCIACFLFIVFQKKLVWDLRRVWLVILSSVLLIYFAAPAQYGLAGAFMDVRFMPFVYLFLVPAIKFKRLPGYVVIGLALLLIFRVAAVETLFVSQQAALRKMSASFDAIPRDAKVMPLVPLPNGSVMGKGDVHHLEYAVIQRGLLDPVVFHLAGIQPIRLVGSLYCPNIYCDAANASNVDWQQVADSYDYLWVHNDPEITSIVSRIGDVIFSNGAVTVYRVRHLATLLEHSEH